MLRALLIVAVLFPLPALAQGEREARRLTMSGMARIAVEPDIVRAQGTVSVEGDGATETLETARTRLADVAAAMKTFGAVHASRIALAQDRSKGTRLIRSDGPAFRADGTVTVTLADPAQAGAALDALVGSGIDGVAYLMRDIAPEKRAALLTKAREAAVADAVERAETYARAAGLTLGPILALEETGARDEPAYAAGPGYGAASSYGAQGAAGPVFVHVGATVRIVWAVE